MNGKLEETMNSMRRRIDELEDQLYGGGLEQEVRKSIYASYTKLSKEYTNLQVQDNMFSVERA